MTNFQFSMLGGEVHLAGELVPPGIYRQIGCGKIVRLSGPDHLPASLDGRVAVYEIVSANHGSASIVADDGGSGDTDQKFS